MTSKETLLTKLVTYKLYIMKNTITIIALLLLFNCKAQQQILSMNTQGMHVENVYYKDLANELDPYEGTWQGTFNNQIFVITFTKVKLHDNIGNYDQDRIIGKYKMLDTNGNTLYSTYSFTNNNAKIISLGFVEQTNRNKLRLMFSDLCIDGEIHINFYNPQKTQIRWKYYTKQSLVVNDSQCAQNNEMPRVELSLLKQ